MSGKFITRRVDDVVLFNWNTQKAYANPNRMLTKDDTYISIFGAYQNDYLEFFLKDPTINIIYKSKKAVNGRAGHGTMPRNTLVIYELADEQQVPKV